MVLNTSYRQIFNISVPIMLGGAAQNIIALSDSVFLYHLSELDFAAIGFVSVFYLMIAAIGYGFSKGGQIMIARRAGEGKYAEIGTTFYAMMVFLSALSMVMFLFMQYGCYYFFSLFVNSDQIFYKSLEYLEYRSWGVFFAYTGVAWIALFTGIARMRLIVATTFLLAFTNIALDYALVFGHWGLPAMGIAGAGLASTIAEVVSFVVFTAAVFLGNEMREFGIFKLPKIDLDLIKQQYKLSSPIVAQSMVGLGSWFVFFGIVENLGERQLAITNLVRMVYLILSIPTWGFASGVNTLVSHFIGNRKRMAVFPITWKTAKLSWITTMIISLPVVLFPQQLLYPLLGGEDMSLIVDAQPTLFVLLGILTGFSIGSVFFNGLSGTGATVFGLKLQAVCAVLYLAYIYVVVEFTKLGLVWAWTSEIFYWAVMLIVTVIFLRSRKWYGLNV